SQTACDPRQTMPASHGGNTGRDGSDLGDGRGSGSKLSQESIPSRRQSFDETGIVGVGSQGVAHPGNGLVETTVEIDCSACRPEALLQFLVGEDFARTFDECHQGLKG